MNLNRSPQRLTAINTGANADRVATPDDCGIVTSSALTTAAAASYLLTVDSPSIDPKGDGSSIVLATVKLGTATTGQPVIGTVQTQLGRAVITVTNRDAAAAFNGTISVSFAVLN